MNYGSKLQARVGKYELWFKLQVCMFTLQATLESMNYDSKLWLLHFVSTNLHAYTIITITIYFLKTKARTVQSVLGKDVVNLVHLKKYIAGQIIFRVRDYKFEIKLF